ncbi:dipeptidase [Botrimarina hoheduenensis]|uniref:Membrane dipeptidase (Peptidase family M19) n=1 Tax=Botrimarina hoheduenensis TaxID=2528000 RepID=A0A5C5WDZ4_9BACT|nr:dipeptidase [Botrimarina hoheduenensis]TWT48820.1 Membrane dipeptidase (Peptidase family M19) [Botrimarina hoheduenensis]
MITLCPKLSPGPRFLGKTPAYPRLAATLLLLMISTHAPADPDPARAPIVVSEEAAALHRDCLVIDGHNDMPWEIRTQGASDFSKLDISQPQPSLQTDLPRAKQGGLDAQFWSVWVPAELDGTGKALSTTLEQIELVRLMLDRYPDQMELALTAEDIKRIAASGKLASLIGVEGGHCIEESLSVLRRLHQLGARYMTLTHGDTISWADSGTDEPRNGGLTAFGQEVVREMNRLGMMVDLSHVSIDVMHQTLDITTAPVLFSHSSARGVADHPRNVPDEVLVRLKESDGVVMVNFFSAFVVPAAAENYATQFNLRRELTAKKTERAEIERQIAVWRSANRMPRGTIHDLLDHIDHIAKVAGPEHVGLGSDYDGVSVLPAGLEDVTSYPRITQGLLDRGYTAEQIRGILGGNLLRVMHGVENAAE